MPRPCRPRATRLTPLGIVVTLLCGLAPAAQTQTPTRAAHLRGALRPERVAFDVVHYAIDMELLPRDSAVAGTVRVAYRGVVPSDTIQLDLDARLRVGRVEQAGQRLGYRREGDAVFVALARPTAPGALDTVVIGYAGQPVRALNPPWDGGLVWSRDSLGRPWVSVSCEGIGASTWWPNKDHLGDEPDSVRFAMTVPDPLRVVGNGRARGTERLPGGRTRYTYATMLPINTYNVTFYAGHYLGFADTLRQSDGTVLDLDYQVIDYNLARARAHFAQVKPMLRCYDGLLGPYPFAADGYKLVEAPYLGMEHQSAIAYGNNYDRGYRGGMIPPDMDWDYLIVHESGHEYFGNAVSVSDHGEMWLHESFTTYLEALYVECRFGPADYQRYLDGQRHFVANREPILGPVNKNYTAFGSSDHYFKGAWVLHTFRTLVGDEAFLEALRAFYARHAIGTVTTTDWLAFVAERFGAGYATFWRQYLTQAEVPLLRIVADGAGGTYAYFERVVPGFAMELALGDERIRVSDAPQRTPIPVARWRAFAPERYLIEVATASSGE